MNELVSQIAQRTGISEDKARQAAEVAINFFKSKLPGVGGQLDGVLHGGASGTSAVGEEVQEGLGYRLAHFQQARYNDGHAAARTRHLRQSLHV